MIYQVNTKVRRKEGAKFTSEVYLVDAVSLTDIETKLILEFGTMEHSITSLKELKLQDIFENGEGTFFTIKVSVEDLEGKVVKEVFIQEASEPNQALTLFKSNIDYGEISDFNQMNYMGIIR